MRFRNLLFLFAIIISINLYGQNLNAYKYIIVPNQYDFLNSIDKYQLNSLTKFLFEKEGFKVLHKNDILPDELVNSPCLGLQADVLDNSGVFRTKLIIVLSNCRNEKIFTSIEGGSKIKDLKRGHHEALRKAFQSIKNLNYSFDKNLVGESKLEKINEVTEAQNIEKVNQPTVKSSSEQKSVELLEVKKDVKNEDISESSKEDTEDVSFALLEDTNKTILYAQETVNGFQLVDSTPKIIFRAYKSLKNENVYYLENKAGILYKKDDEWYAEYYRGTVMVIEKLNIKF